MREILFRGKRVRPDRDTGRIEWVYGLYMTVYGTPNIELEDGRECDVDAESIGEYTGICDKNGTKIFEGDIVRAEHNITETFADGSIENGDLAIREEIVDSFTAEGAVYFENGSFEVEGFNLGIFRELEIEVIGNIHDNSELLKGEK